MFYMPTATLPYLLTFVAVIALGKILIRLVKWCVHWHMRQISGKFRAQPVGPEDGGLARINLLRLGQNAGPRTSLNTILLRTTLGVRLWAVATNLLLNAVLWIIAPGEVIALGWPTILLSLAGAIACLGLFLYEARVEYDRLIIRKWGLFHREYPWADLREIRDDGHYEYILRFGKTDVRMPKHLVGVSGFLTFVQATIAGNIHQHARIARS